MPSQSLTFTLPLPWLWPNPCSSSSSPQGQSSHPACSALLSTLPSQSSQEDWLGYMEGANHCHPNWLFTPVYMASISSCSALGSFWDLSSFVTLSCPTDSPSQTLPACTEIIFRAFLLCAAASSPDILPVPCRVALKRLYLYRSPNTPGLYLHWQSTATLWPPMLEHLRLYCWCFSSFKKWEFAKKPTTHKWLY